MVSVDFDHSRPSLFLTFSEPVYLDSINCHQGEFTYFNHPEFPTSIVTPAYPGWCNQSDQSKIEFQLDPRDYLLILKLGNLWTSTSDSFLHWSGNLGHGVNITAGESVVDSITPDTSSPFVIAFNLDLELGALTIIFDSIVNPSSLDFTSLLLQETNSGSATLGLTGGSLPEDCGTTLCLQLTTEDQMTLRNSPICRDVGSCYLSVLTGAVEDFFGITASPSVVQVYTFY